jgi:lipopolysaccharide biosynthesis glycosyltransferase
VTVDSIDQLLTVDLLGCIAGCVQDSAVPFVSSPLGIAGWERLGLPPSLGYFNAGVMSIDADLWTTHRIGERALDFARDHPEEAVLADQGPLNAVLAQSWLPLDGLWNVRTQLGYARQVGVWTISRRGIRRAPRAAILHFGGPVKPWHPNFPPSPDRTTYLNAWHRWLPDFAPSVSVSNFPWYAHRLRGRARAS